MKKEKGEIGGSFIILLAIIFIIVLVISYVGSSNTGENRQHFENICKNSAIVFGYEYSQLDIPGNCYVSHDGNTWKDIREVQAEFKATIEN